MQVAFFPPPAATPTPDAAHAADSGVPAGDSADVSFASLLDSNAGQPSAGSVPSPSSSDTAVVDDAVVAQPALRKPAAAVAPDPLSVPEFLTAAAAMCVAAPSEPAAQNVATDSTPAEPESIPVSADDVPATEAGGADRWTATTVCTEVSAAPQESSARGSGTSAVPAYSTSAEAAHPHPASADMAIPRSVWAPSSDLLAQRSETAVPAPVLEPSPQGTSAAGVIEPASTKDLSSGIAATPTASRVPLPAPVPRTADAAAVAPVTPNASSNRGQAALLERRMQETTHSAPVDPSSGDTGMPGAASAASVLPGQVFENLVRNGIEPGSAVAMPVSRSGERNPSQGAEPEPTISGWGMPGLRAVEAETAPVVVARQSSDATAPSFASPHSHPRPALSAENEPRVETSVVARSISPTPAAEILPVQGEVETTPSLPRLHVAMTKVTRLIEVNSIGCGPGAANTPENQPGVTPAAGMSLSTIPSVPAKPSTMAAVRTLAQVLADNVPAAQPSGSGKTPSVAVPQAAAVLAPTAETTNPTSVESPTTPAAENSPTGTQAIAKPAPETVSRSSEAGVTPATNTEVETDPAEMRAPVEPSRERAENLAVARNMNARRTQRIEHQSRGRNFLDVERQGLEKRAPSLGTGIAKETQPMSVHTPVLPPASAALDSNEPAAASVSTAQTATIPATKPSGETHALRSHAVELVRETLEVAERAQAAGRNQVELRLPGADGDLRVRLSWHDGVVHTKFVTHDVDLQQALSREWEHAAPKLAEKGLKFGEPSFENRDQSGQSAAQNASDFDQQRHSSRGQGQDGSERAPEFTLRPSASHTAAMVRRTAHSAATAAVAPGKPTLAETRGLRAWA